MVDCYYAFRGNCRRKMERMVDRIVKRQNLCQHRSREIEI